MKFDQEYFNKILGNHPELLAFLCPGVESTSDYNTTEQAGWTTALYQDVKFHLNPEDNASAEDDEPPVFKLIDKANPNLRSIELERTMLCIMCLDAVYSGNHTFFEKSPVPFGKSITKEQFNKLYLNLIQQFPKETSRKIIFCALVLGDIGKIKPLREMLCKEFSISERLLGRLLCMFRIYSAEEAATLQASLAHLAKDDQFTRDLAILDSYQANPKFHTPTYMPALLNALKANTNLTTLATSEDEDAQTTALRVGMRLIAMSLLAHEKHYANNKNPVNFNGLTALAKGDLTEISQLLQKQNMGIDASGNATISTNLPTPPANSSWLGTVGKVALFAAIGVGAVFAIKKLIENSETLDSPDLSATL